MEKKKTMITEIYAYEEAPSSYGASIFLVGPTPRSDEVKSWRPEALTVISKLFEKYNIHLVIFIPEPRNKTYSSNYLDQVEWEKQHLEMADAILAWVPRDMKTSFQGLTTNIEFGKYVESGKLFYGRPANADRIKYLDWMYTDLTGRQPANDLVTLANEVTHHLQALLDKCDPLERKEGERYVPLTIWGTPFFQNWYQRQRQAGNKLLKAKSLWTFIIPKINFTFSYALHVDVWIAAEDRVKSNEFIISRPDISVIVPYWRHPTDPFESEIVLIKEFRSPARTADGFVYELPGGSSFRKGDYLQVAVDECYEETGLKIEPKRFKPIASKQLAATWSTHFADVYAIELEPHEIEHAKELARLKRTFGVEEDTELTYVEVCKLREIGKYVDWSMEGMIYRVIFN